MNPFEEYGFEPVSESYDEDSRQDTLYSIKVNDEIFYIEYNEYWYWSITNSYGMPLFHEELDRAEKLSIRECKDYLSEYFPLVYGFSLEDREQFMKADLARFIAKESLSSDEWESLAYPMFENKYIDRRKPSEKSILGHLEEPEVFEIARRFHNGEDIRRELALGLLDFNSDIEIVFGEDGITSSTYRYGKDTPRYKIHAKKTEDGVKLSLFDKERIVSYEEIGQKFIDLIHKEFEDLAYWAVLDFIKDEIPDISDETVKSLITAFDNNKMHGWDSGDDQAKINRIKKALNEFLSDEEQTEKAFTCIAKRKYNVEFADNSSKTAVFSLEQNGEVQYFKTAETAEKLLETVKNSEHAFIDISKLGTRISEAEFAEIEQSKAVTFSAEIDLDIKTAKLTEINNGKGGIADPDRNSENTSVQEIRLDGMEITQSRIESMKYMGIETEAVRSELARSAGIPISELDALLKEECFEIIAHDLLKGLEQISGIDDPDTEKAEETLLQSQGIDMAGLRFDLYEAARAHYSAELTDSIRNGTQDIVFTKFYFEGDTMKLYPGRYDDITDVPDWEEVRRSLLCPENGVDDNVKVRCEQFVIGCGSEREERNERNALPSELVLLESCFKNEPHTYELPQEFDSRLKKTYDDSEFVMMYLDPDDVVYDILLNGEKKHNEAPEMTNSAFRDVFIQSSPRFALEQIKLNCAEWKKWDEAIMYMTDNKLTADDVDMVAVAVIDSSGARGVRDMTPEGLFVLNKHTVTNSLAAGMAMKKHGELMKRAEAERKEKESEPALVKKNSGRK